MPGKTPGPIEASHFVHKRFETGQIDQRRYVRPRFLVMLRPSRVYLVLFLGVVALAIIAILLTSISWAVKSLLLLLLGALVREQTGSGRVQGLSFDGGRWALLRGGVWQNASLASSSVMTEHMLLLNWQLHRAPRFRRSVASALFSDSCSAAELSALRTALLECRTSEQVESRQKLEPASRS